MRKDVDKKMMMGKDGCPPDTKKYKGECSYIKSIRNKVPKLLAYPVETIITLTNGEVIEVLPRDIFLYDRKKNYRGWGLGSKNKMGRRESKKQEMYLTITPKKRG